MITTDAAAHDSTVSTHKVRAIRVSQPIGATVLPPVSTSSIPYYTASTLVNRVHSPFGNGLMLVKIIRSEAKVSALLPTYMGSRRVRALKLTGYTIQHRDHAGIHEEHNVTNDEALGLLVDGVGGDIISNNEHFNRCFAVLFCGLAQNSSTHGSVSMHTSDTDRGIYCTTFDPPRLLPRLTCELIGADGRTVQVGKLQLWFKVLCD